MASLLTKTFRSSKSNSIRRNPVKSPQTPSRIALNDISTKSQSSKSSTKSYCDWSVYLIISTNLPIKTYVGVTNNFPRRLRQHNGELRGGAKASLAGRPWICACLISGFMNRSKACELESKWKISSRRLPRKRSKDKQEQANNTQLLLLQHREAALNKVKDLIDCNHLQIHWHLDPY